MYSLQICWKRRLGALRNSEFGKRPLREDSVDAGSTPITSGWVRPLLLLSGHMGSFGPAADRRSHVMGEEEGAVKQLQKMAQAGVLTFLKTLWGTLMEHSEAKGH